MNRRKKIEKAGAAALVVFAIAAAALLPAWAGTESDGQKPLALRSTIAFVSSRHDPAADQTTDAQRAFLAAEIYLIDGDGTNPRRLTENSYADGFPALSPDGSRIVFDSNRLRTEGEPINTSDLFVMNADGTEQVFVRGLQTGSASFSPAGGAVPTLIGPVEIE